MSRLARLVLCLMTASLVIPWAAVSAAAHELGSSAVLMDVGEDRVTAELQLPLDQLEIAVDLPLIADPDAVLQRYGSELQRYVADHVSVRGVDGEVWSSVVEAPTIEIIDDADHLVLDIEMVPPSGVVSDFVLTYDVVVEYLQSHKVALSATFDGSDRVLLDTIDIATTEVVFDGIGLDGSVIDLGQFWDTMVFGFEHVVAGADHILFLVVLLLPAPVAAVGGRWGDHRSPRQALRRVLQVSLAFTLGHSVTLAAVVLGWITFPSRPIEALIAVSIAVGAVHCVRPLMANGEAWIAGAFGLIHGMAFAGILTDDGFGAASTLTTLLAFNIGVEMAQLATVALVLPHLLLLSRRRAYRGIRLTGAALAALAASGWIADRVFAITNPFAGAETWLIERPVVLVASLTAITLAVSLVGERRTPLVQPNGADHDQPFLKIPPRADDRPRPVDDRSGVRV